ncbi:hypothetical protein EW146_g13 [Bondarzewia mesenterica]|uniref:Uncharacterized protein n=1 Tax=Bondarzewia mesenterica TaxID=1095465 RepID=A0A4V6S1L9_9AGAM|nr:hypothetical protein EW146_g13 [Bondarzewia mesenterica]
MISLLPQATQVSLHAEDEQQDALQMNEVRHSKTIRRRVTRLKPYDSPYLQLGNVHDALKPITELLSRSFHDQAIRLYCTVPTWAPSSDICIDLHDLHDLRSRSLLFIHELVESLRASGVSASYTLAPSNSSLCLVCASHSVLNKSRVEECAREAFEKTKPCAREKVHLVQLKDGPALVIT